MSTNPQADAWMESYQVPWGAQPGGDIRTESLRDSVVSTNRNAVNAAVAAQTALDRLAPAGLESLVHDTVVGVLRAQEFNAPFRDAAYRLIRDDQTGAVYAYAPGVFFWIETPDVFKDLDRVRLVPQWGWWLESDTAGCELVRKEMSRAGDAGIGPMAGDAKKPAGGAEKSI